MRDETNVNQPVIYIPNETVPQLSMDNDVETDESLSYSEEVEENKDLEVEMNNLLEKVVDVWSCKACGKTNKSKV